MKASRKRPKGAYRWSFGFLVCSSVLMPTSIGYQDLAALIARQPAVTERWRAHVRTASFSTIHATFSFPRPVGSAIPDPYFTQLAALDPRALDVTGSVPLPAPLEPQAAAPVYDYPVVQRRLKGDRLPSAAAPQAAPDQEPAPQPQKLKDQASLIPGPKPVPEPASPENSAEDAGAVQGPFARKGDREAPASAPEPQAPVDPAQDRALDQVSSTLTKIADVTARLTAARSKPVPVASHQTPTGPLEIKPVADKSSARPVPDRSRLETVRRGDAAMSVAAIAAGRSAQANRRLGEIERKPAPVASPVDDAALNRTVEGTDALARAMRAVARVLPLAGKSPAVAQQRKSPVEAAARAEVAKADLSVSRDPATQRADAKAQRADSREPLQPQSAPATRAPKVEAPKAVAAAPVEQAPAGVAKAPAQKQNDRFEVVDSLAQYSSPQSTRIYFGTHEIGFGKGSLQRWEPDEAPTVLAPPHVDPEIKRAALDPLPESDVDAPGETVAPKGEVTGEGKRPRTPAERLNLTGAVRVKHEKCLSNAIYFEARGEVERGQMAVAQVILNRAFSGYYPGNVCDVVYQNAHRHLACQFTFACDNVRDVVNDQKAWAIATRIASEALDGKFWLPEVGKATHYHATYVNPWWVRTMTKHSKLGIHIFYRPKRWGDGEEIPVWGDRLDVTGTITPMPLDPDKETPAKRASAQPAKLRSIFDPVEEITPGS